MAKPVPGVPKNHPSQPQPNEEAILLRQRRQWERKVDGEAFAMKQSIRRSTAAQADLRMSDYIIERRVQDKIIDRLVSMGALGKVCG